MSEEFHYTLIAEVTNPLGFKKKLVRKSNNPVWAMSQLKKAVEAYEREFYVSFEEPDYQTEPLF